MGMRNSSGNPEMTVRPKTAELIAILEKNRTTHIEEYKAACVGYRVQLIEQAEKAELEVAKFAEQLRATPENASPKAMLGVKIPHVGLSLTPPQNHEKDYDRAIAMLKMHSDDTILIDWTTYAQYVDDDWEWAAQTKMLNSGYANSGAVAGGRAQLGG